MLKQNVMNASVILSFVLFILPMEIDMMEKKIEMEIKDIVPDIVAVTTYTPSVEETDSTPLITASGFKINPANPKRHRIIAVSRDLKKKYKFGKKVRITGIGKLSGTYTIRDVMNKRYKKRVDILIGENDKQISFKNAKLYAVVK
jgi:3D (Asp-Asp-Asp) domain-containing protein